MEKIQPGKYVEIAYDLYASLPGQPETQVHTVEASEPERFIYSLPDSSQPSQQPSTDSRRATRSTLKFPPTRPSPSTPTM